MGKPAEESQPIKPFDVTRERDVLTVRCNAILDSSNIKEFKAITSEAALFQPLQSIGIDFQSQPVDPEQFQVVVQLASGLKLLHKKLTVRQATQEFLRAVASNGLGAVIQAQAETATEPGQEVKKEPGAGDPNFPPATRFLIVDDIQSVRSLIKVYLRELGYTNVEEAHSADEALSKLESATGQNRFQVIISDWYMPGTTGLELFSKMRALIPADPPHFILVTVETERTNVMKALQEGIKHYLVKPFTMERVQQSLREIWMKEAPGKSAS